MEENEIENIISFMRTWENNPPIGIPLEIDAVAIALNGAQIHETICAACHGQDGKGGVGPSINSAEFRESHDDEYLRSINQEGREGTVMLA